LSVAQARPRLSAVTEDREASAATSAVTVNTIMYKEWKGKTKGRGTSETMGKGEKQRIEFIYNGMFTAKNI
jgi:hypothetical protein